MISRHANAKQALSHLRQVLASACDAGSSATLRRGGIQRCQIDKISCRSCNDGHEPCDEMG
jgi:hypothetical protein